MCFCITVDNPPLVAHRDMVCYKVLSKNMRSWFQGFKYTMNKIYRTKLGALEEKNFTYRFFTSLGKEITTAHMYCIFSGFHSYQRNTKQISRWYNSGSRKTSCIYKCAIPKGSFYYKNQWGEYVSDQIVIKEKVNFK